MKAWQLITHSSASPTYRKLRSKISIGELDLVGSFQATEQVWLAWERTAGIARALGAGLVLFQCPASFLPTRENLRNFEEFFSRVEVENFALAWEPRGAWPLHMVQQLCKKYNLEHCIDPFQISSSDTLSTYWRLHGKAGYRYKYSDEDLDELERLVSEATQKHGKPVRVMFNNVWMKEDALRFQSKFQNGRKLVL